MKKVVALAFLVLGFKVQAQVALPNIPTDRETKLISYTDVVNQTGVDATELFKRANEWYTKYFNNPTEKLRKKDDEAKSLELFVRFKLFNVDKKGVKTDAGELMQYTLNIACKDGKYRYEFTKFNLKAASYKPAEPLLDKASPTFERNAVWLKQVDEEIKKVIDDLEKGMAATPKKKDDW
jgi:hypothetical protein